MAESLPGRHYALVMESAGRWIGNTQPLQVEFQASLGYYIASFALLKGSSEVQAGFKVAM